MGVEFHNNKLQYGWVFSTETRCLYTNRCISQKNFSKISPFYSQQIWICDIINKTLKSAAFSEIDKDRISSKFHLSCQYHMTCHSFYVCLVLSCALHCMSVHILYVLSAILLSQSVINVSIK